MHKQVAITGATGFIGTKLVMQHLLLGDRVRVLSRKPQEKTKLPASIEYFHGDLGMDSNLQPFVDGIDILYHCAGELHDYSRMEDVHVMGTRRLLEAATGRIGRWVQLSSTGAYGIRRNGVITEKTELKPSGIYEKTKVASDKLVTEASSGGAFESVILRPSIVFGAGMPNRSIYSLISMVQRGWFFFIGQPGASANYVHVDNVVEALIACGKAPQANGEVYNLSDYLTMEQFIVIISRLLGCPIPKYRFPEMPVRVLASLLGIIPGFPLTSSRVRALTGRVMYSTEKIEKELGYQRIISMETGLAELVDFWTQYIRPNS